MKTVITQLKKKVAKIKIKGILKGSDIIFTKHNIGFYMKALSTNYKQVFKEFKNRTEILRYFNFFRNFLIQTFGV